MQIWIVFANDKATASAYECSLFICTGLYRHVCGTRREGKALQDIVSAVLSRISFISCIFIVSLPIYPKVFYVHNLMYHYEYQMVESWQLRCRISHSQSSCTSVRNEHMYITANKLKQRQNIQKKFSINLKWKYFFFCM